MMAASCASRAPFAFPTGTPTPTPDAAAAWQAATAACRAAANYSAEIVIDGRVGAETLRRVTLQGAMTRDGRIRLLAVAPIGGPIFILAGRADRATLTLPRDHRVLVAPVADIVNALIGLRFAPVDWVDVLSGCVSGSARADGGQLGADLEIALGNGARALLRKNGAEWRVVAGQRLDAVIEYREYQGRWPSLARISSASTTEVPINVGLAIGQIFVNADLSDRAFMPDVPADFAPMTLAELRAIGPLGEKR